MVEPRCDVCGRKFPSEHWLRTATTCIECFEALPAELQQQLSGTASVPASAEEAAAKPQFTWKTILGMVVGSVIGHYSKMNLLIPLVTVGLSTWTFTKTFRGRRLVVAKVAGALVGYALWVAFGLLAGLYLEVGIELLLVGAVSLFLLVRPSRESLAVVGAWLTLSLLFNVSQLISFEIGSENHRAIVAHLALRLYSLYVLYEAWKALSEGAKAKGDPPPASGLIEERG